jgi:hypothetical protein
MTTTDTTAAELAARHLDCSDVKETSTKRLHRYRSRQPASAGRADGVGPCTDTPGGAGRPGVRRWAGDGTAAQRQARLGKVPPRSAPMTR